MEASAEVAKYSNNHTVVVEDTLPVKPAEVIKKILQSSSVNEKKTKDKKTFSILSNRVFSRSTAINNLRQPDRVLIGGEDTESINTLSEIYEKW